MLDYNYHAAKLSGVASGDISSDNKTLWWSHLDLFLTASGNVYRWNAEPYNYIFSAGSL